MTNKEIEAYRRGFKNGAGYFDKLNPCIDRPEAFDEFTKKWWDKDVWTGEKLSEAELKARVNPPHKGDLIPAL